MGERSILKSMINFSMYILIILIITYVVVTFVAQRTQVSGRSMEYTLNDNDQVIVDKFSYRIKEPERFDIIVFPYQYEEDTFYIKRIIGLPGETVRIEENTIYINDQVLEESYGREVMLSAGRVTEPVVLGSDEYFVLGDNRNESADSRDPSVGNIKRGDIIGKAWLRIWPFADFGILRHQ